jgi:hypothetical protein
VLEALGQQHPDKRIGKAARKASFRHRSNTKPPTSSRGRLT